MKPNALVMVTGIALLTVGLQAQETVIVRNGHSDYRIVVPDKKSPAVGYAATELQQFVRQATGVRLAVVRESAAGTGPAFVLGPCERSRKAGLVDQAAKSGADGVLIRSLGNDIALLGQNERGNLYSVYVLLEKYLGVRFLAWDCTIVPKRKELTLPRMDYVYAPPFMYRETLYFDSFPKEIAARQRLNGPYTKCDESVGGKIAFFPYVHSFSTLFPEKEYFKDHPEYFGLQGGKRVAGTVHTQLCLSNPEVLRLATEKVFKWIAEHPDVPIIDVSQNDGNGACECEPCMAIVNEEGSQHGPILRFVNAIADEVAKKHPDKWIETLAYAYSTKPPSLTKPRPNVIVRLCHAGCYFHGFEKCGLGANLTTNVDAWSSVTQRIFIWHYGTNFSHYLAPNPNLAGLASDIKFYATHGVNGLMVQCNFQGHGGELAELREYLSAQLMWNPEADPMAIRTDFCRGYYGESSQEVLDFLQLLDRVAEKPDVHAFGAWDPSSKVSPEFVDEALGILERARSAASGEITRNRVGKLMLPFWFMKLTWPARYGLAQPDAAAMWKQAQQVITRNKITHTREGEPNMPGWITEMSATHGARRKDVVLDLTAAGQAVTQNCADWRASTVKRDGRTLRAVFHHPAATDNSDATYEVALPALPKGKKLLLKFGTVITNKTNDGVRFAVLANGTELWNETKTTFISDDEPTTTSGHENILPGRNPFSDHKLDLSAHAGQTIRLTLRVNALQNSSNDWANWVEPRIVAD